MGLLLVRVVLPAAIAVSGVVLVVLANLFIRLALQSEQDRRREQERRR
jgi:Flp pilus assembly protein TadB